MIRVLLSTNMYGSDTHALIGAIQTHVKERNGVTVAKYALEMHVTIVKHGGIRAGTDIVNLVATDTLGNAAKSGKGGKGSAGNSSAQRELPNLRELQLNHALSLDHVM
ncbi:uncharacterized protein LOC117317936 [Pecten maximus]|uniref:uncharacterized protein LOC117317936 n=1 Tax=Pecten maximus TaxID=6579 RepID=UPI001458E682|nr:uncharacterized protein LOC117317936 [Pecten maximus]